MALSLDSTVTTTAAPATGKTNYSMYKLNGKNPAGATGGSGGSTVRVRNTPLATPTIVTPGNGLPVMHRSTTFSQLKGAAPPSNAASSKPSRPPTRNTRPASSRATRPSAAAGAATGSNGVIAKYGETNITTITKPMAPPPAAPKQSTGAPKQSASVPSGAKSSSATSKSSSLAAPKDTSASAHSTGSGTKSREHSNSATNAAAASAATTTARRVGSGSDVSTSEPPHHNKIKKELRNKMTAAETIVIRNITKQNYLSRKAHHDKRSPSQRGSGKAAQSGGKIGVTSSSPKRVFDAGICGDGGAARDDTTRTSPRGAESNCGDVSNATSDNAGDGTIGGGEIERDGPHVSETVARSTDDVTHVADANGAEYVNEREQLSLASHILSARDEPVDSLTLEQHRNNDDVSSPPQSSSRHAAAAAKNIEISKKITLHLSPHGARGSKDGGKPATSMRFAAIYPTSPYVETVSAVPPLNSANGVNSVPQLRMCHNGVVMKSKRVPDVVGGKPEAEKPNRGS